MKRSLMLIWFWAAGIFLAALLFGGAGRIDVPRFWVYLGVYAGFMVAAALLVDPDLVRERIRPGGKRQPVILHLARLLFLLHLLVAGIEAGRHRWTPPVPPAVESAAMVAFSLGWGGVLWAMHANRFFSSVVRIQTERGQTVVTGGPYRWVRHPGYAAAMVLCPASGMALGSWAAVLVLLPLVLYLFYRTVTEDAFLMKNLAGYPEYAARVRHRLLPGVW